MVVDDASPLGGKVSGKAVFDQAVQQRPRTVLDEVGTVGQHDRRSTFACCEHYPCQTIDFSPNCRIRRSLGLQGLACFITQAQQIATLRKGQDAKLQRIKRGMGHGIVSSL